MGEIARALSPEDINAASSWLSGQPVPADYAPSSVLPKPPAGACGSMPGSSAARERHHEAACAGIGILLGSVLAVVALAGGVIAWQSLRQRRSWRDRPGTDRQAQLAKANTWRGPATAWPATPRAAARPMPVDAPCHALRHDLHQQHHARRATGIGDWSADDFWRALHHGRGRDGRFLYPAFPYTSYTQISREDSDALFAYLRTLPAESGQPPHAVALPLRPACAAGSVARIFLPPAATSLIRPLRPMESRRLPGAGAGHCSACHSARNVVGASMAPLTWPAA
jgi:mono/diheme cytochrome c family protein